MRKIIEGKTLPTIIKFSYPVYVVFLVLTKTPIFTAIGMFIRFAILMAALRYTISLLKKHYGNKPNIGDVTNVNRVLAPCARPDFYGAGVYAIKVSKFNHWKVYVGESEDVMNRWGTHKHNLINQTHHQQELQKYYNQGYKLEFFILHTLPEEERKNKALLHRLERFYWCVYAMRTLNKDPYEIDAKHGKVNESRDVTANSYHTSPYGWSIINNNFNAPDVCFLTFEQVNEDYRHGMRPEWKKNNA